MTESKRSISCKSCGEYWHWFELDSESVQGLLSYDDKIELGLPTDIDFSGPALDVIRDTIMGIISNSGGCFSCSFSKTYMKSYGGALVIGDVIVNIGEVVFVEGDVPDPSTGIFDTEVNVVLANKNEPITVGFYEELIILRSKG